MKKEHRNWLVIYFKEIYNGKQCIHIRSPTISFPINSQGTTNKADKLKYPINRMSGVWTTN
jgi:hypothetical protein